MAKLVFFHCRKFNISIIYNGYKEMQQLDFPPIFEFVVTAQVVNLSSKQKNNFVNISNDYLFIDSFNTNIQFKYSPESSNVSRTYLLYKSHFFHLTHFFAVMAYLINFFVIDKLLMTDMQYYTELASERSSCYSLQSLRNISLMSVTVFKIVLV